MASFLYNKFFLHLPFYRQEEYMRQTDGFVIPRQTMVRWAIRLACVFLWRVYEHMLCLEADCPTKTRMKLTANAGGSRSLRSCISRRTDALPGSRHLFFDDTFIFTWRHVYRILKEIMKPTIGA